MKRVVTIERSTHMAMHSFPPPPVDARPDFAFPCVAEIARVRGSEVSVLVEGRVEPALARLASPISPGQVEEAHAAGHSAIVIFERGDPDLPIVVGLLAPPPEPPGVATEVERARAPGEALQADVDGKRVVLTAEDEVVLQCGAASITLRRNGRVVIRGAYVETYATGTNRIKGGNVRIN